MTVARLMAAARPAARLNFASMRMLLGYLVSAAASKGRAASVITRERECRRVQCSLGSDAGRSEGRARAEERGHLVGGDRQGRAAERREVKAQTCDVGQADAGRDAEAER